MTTGKKAVTTANNILLPKAVGPNILCSELASYSYSQLYCPCGWHQAEILGQMGGEGLIPDCVPYINDMAVVPAFKEEIYFFFLTGTICHSLSLRRKV